MKWIRIWHAQKQSDFIFVIVLYVRTGDNISARMRTLCLFARKPTAYTTRNRWKNLPASSQFTKNEILQLIFQLTWILYKSALLNASAMFAYYLFYYKYNMTASAGVIFRINGSDSSTSVFVYSNLIFLFFVFDLFPSYSRLINIDRHKFYFYPACVLSQTQIADVSRRICIFGNFILKHLFGMKTNKK